MKIEATFVNLCQTTRRHTT